MANYPQQQQTQQVVKFNPQTLRNDVVKQMEQMQNANFTKLPANYKQSAMFAIDALSTLYGIEQVPATDITKTLINMFTDQLDFRKKHVYFFVQNDKNSPSGKSLRYGMQYQGLVHIAKQQCGVYQVTPVLVHEGDTFETHYQNGALIIDNHVPTFEGAIKGGYCVVEFEDKNLLIRFFTKAELDKRRGLSRAKDGNFWNWEREMYEKTLINGTLKRIIETSSEVSINEDSLYADEREEFTTGRHVEDAIIIEQGEPTEVAQPQQLHQQPSQPVAQPQMQAQQGIFEM